MNPTGMNSHLAVIDLNGFKCYVELFHDENGDPKTLTLNVWKDKQLVCSDSIRDIIPDAKSQQALLTSKS